MQKIWAVIRREFVERVRTKAFVIGTLLGPLFFGALMIIPGLLLSKQSVNQRLVIVDALDGDFGSRVIQALSTARVGKGPDAQPAYEPVRVPAVGRVQEVRDSLVPFVGLSKERASSIDGILVLDEEALASSKVNYYGKNVGSMQDMGQLRTTLTPLLISERLKRVGVDPVVALRASTPLDLATWKVSEGKLTGETGASTFALAYVMGIILYMALVLYGTQVMSSIIEEKSNRIVEVLISSLTPFQMMLGKVVGVGLVSLLQIGIWASAAALLSKYQAPIMKALGVASAGGGIGSMLPSMRPDLLIVFLLFFVLGFLLYSSAYAAVGSMCNTMQETQQAQTPIMICTLIGWFSAIGLLRDPTGPVAKVASLIPPSRHS